MISLIIILSLVTLLWLNWCSTRKKQPYNVCLPSCYVELLHYYVCTKHLFCLTWFVLCQLFVDQKFLLKGAACFYTLPFHYPKKKTLSFTFFKSCPHNWFSVFFLRHFFPLFYFLVNWCRTQTKWSSLWKFNKSYLKEALWQEQYCPFICKKFKKARSYDPPSK